MKNILLLKMGTTSESVRISIGDYDRWFLNAVGPSGVRFDVVEVALQGRVSRPIRDYDAVWMTGLPSSLTRKAPWMERGMELVREAMARDVPFLGVCFGHQLLGDLLGVEVCRSPSGREIGTVEMRLTEAGQRDPLFKGVGPSFLIQTTHEDILPHPPPGATVLAWNTASQVQALTLGRSVRAVQFHPELSPEGMRALIQARRTVLEKEAVQRGESPQESVERLLGGIHTSPAGTRILQNFVAHFT